MEKIIPLAVAFICGVAVEFVNFLITRSALEKKSLAAIFPLRSLVAAAFLAALYFASRALGLNVTACMIAGVVGASAALAAFTALLIRSTRKGGEDDG